MDVFEDEMPSHPGFFDVDDQYYDFWRELGVSKPTAKAQHYRWRKARGYVNKGW